MSNYSGKIKHMWYALHNIGFVWLEQMFMYFYVDSYYSFALLVGWKYFWHSVYRFTFYQADSGGMCSPGGLSFVGRSKEILGEIPAAIACKRIHLDEAIARAAARWVCSCNWSMKCPFS